MTNFEIADTDTDMQVFESADTDADTDMKVFETADTDADTDMNFSKNRGHGHGADKPRTRVSADLWPKVLTSNFNFDEAIWLCPYTV